jgi:putative addiction module killer protein
MDQIKIAEYTTKTGKVPFSDWLESLDKITRSIIRSRLNRIRLGNFGDTKSIQGCSSLYELRIAYGSGYRVYFGKEGKEIVILLMGGDKGSQLRDIAKAQRYWLEYKDLK